jgi:hypothetical protein
MPFKSVNDPRSRQSTVDLYTQGDYLANNPTWGVEDSAWKAEKIATLFAKHQLILSKVCEIGCGAGEILRQLSIRFPQTYFSGYEVSPQAFTLCESRASTNVQFFLRDVLDETETFDAALCIDVFEHVEDYFGFLRRLKAKATYKVFHIPLDVSVLSIFRSSMMTARTRLGHLHYFSRETALATLQDCGYEILDWSYTTGFVDLPSKSLSASLARLPRRAVHALSADLNAKLLGGSSLLVLAK